MKTLLEAISQVCFLSISPSLKQGVKFQTIAILDRPTVEMREGYEEGPVCTYTPSAEAAKSQTLKSAFAFPRIICFVGTHL